MNYFFGNERNDRGLCATPGCTGKAVSTFVYKYCEQCYAAITSDLESDLGLDIGLETVGERGGGNTVAAGSGQRYGVGSSS